MFLEYSCCMTCHEPGSLKKVLPVFLHVLTLPRAHTTRMGLVAGPPDACKMQGEDSWLQNWSTHSEEPWQVQGQLHFLLLGLEVERGGRSSDLPPPPVSAFPPLHCWVVIALGSWLLVACSLAQMSSDKVASWEFPRVSKDWLNFRAHGWCCLEWLVTSLHLLALVPLKWNPTFSRNVELSHPGSKNTLIR